jgi:phosphatidylglycerol lysyltransferase
MSPLFTQDTAKPTAALPSAVRLRDSQRARELVLRYGWNSTAYQILNPGLSLWFAPDGEGVVGYVSAYGYRVIAGEPVCDPRHLNTVTQAFEADTRRTGQRVCYFGAQDRLILALDRSRPLSGVLLGAQPVWRPAYWSERIERKSSLRAQLARARNKQVQVTRWPAERATNHADLRRCLDQWLYRRRLPPMHFLVEPDTLGLLIDRQVWVAEQHGSVVGFLVASPIPDRNGWLIEQIIRCGSAPNGTTELMLDTAMQHLASTGASYVTLGLSPLSRRAGSVESNHSVLVQALLALTKAYGQHFYNFAGLDAYKAKFLPEWWEPVYAITRERHMSLYAFYAIAGAFSSTSPLLYVTHGVGRELWRMARQQVSLMRRSPGSSP